MKCPQCQQENRAAAKFCEECATPLKALGPDSPHAPSYAEVTSALSEAQEQQTATAEILRVIGSSPSDLQPVFDIIAKRATALTDAVYGAVYLVEGESIHLRAYYSDDIPNTRQFAAAFPMPITSQTLIAETLRTGTLANIADMEDVSVPEAGRTLARALGVRSTLTVPMRRDGHPIGAIGVNRRKPGDFTSAEIALLQTFADQAVIAVENVRLFSELQARNRDLATALEQQTATAEILHTISRSYTDVQPVFQAIVDSAARLLSGHSAVLSRIVDDRIDLAAYTHTDEAGDALLESFFPVPLHSSGSDIRPIRDRVIGQQIPYNVADVETDPRVGERGRASARARGYRSQLVVPMLRDGDPIGTLAVTRREPGAFTDEETALLQTFADQAVIAIENVRLFTELQEKNRALTEAHTQVSEALERQTATSEILRIISRSPTNIQPVFEAIVQSAVRLCNAFFAIAFRFDGNELAPVAHHGFTPDGLEMIGRAYPSPPRMDTMAGRAVLERQTLHIADVSTASSGRSRELALAIGYRAFLAIPMVREGEAIGVINVARREAEPFSERQIEVMNIFADQAVIAIENVRLFKELQASNKHLTDALDKQMATSDILRVISRSQTDVQPVFEEILSSAVRLMGAQAGALTRITGDHLHLAAFKGTDKSGESTLRAAFPLSLQIDGAHANAFRNRTPVNIAEAQSETGVRARSIARAVGYQSMVVVPMLHHQAAVGTISAVRREPGGFTEDEIALLQTFADQAVIAIENARLLSELQTRTDELTRSVEQLTALGDVGRAVSSTLDLETVLTTIVSRAVELSALDGGVVFEYDDSVEEFVHRVATEVGGALAEARRTTRVRKGEGVVGQTALTLEPAQVPDIAVPGAYESRLRENLIESGIRALLAVPMLREGELIGCLVVSRNRPGEFPAETIDLLRTFATQSALAIQNARLFREIEQKSRELEAASRHKSEFLANMSHELRTPLNAVIGFSEVLSERMFGELNEKQEEYLKDIHASGQHLLSLINDILDLSKIEAGKMELELSDFDLPMTIDNALMLVRERAARRSITLNTAIDERVGQVHADERKIRQVLLNLLSNAIKFTPEGGRIHVEARSVNESIEVSVTDTGVGIALEDQQAVFEEFRQVGTAEKKVEGTGLGLALSRKFIELHGGTIWVESQVGEGSTFTFTVPVRRGE